jgi:uncharacterized protein involved in exopolysaccharide biosynthesis
MRNSSRVPSEDIAVMSLWSVLMRSWLRVMIIAGFAGAAVFTALALVPTRYSATTELRLPTPSSKEAVAATVTALQSRDLARKVAADLDLTRTADLNGQPMARDIIGWLDRLSGRALNRPVEARDASVLAAFERSLRVAGGRAEGTVNITVTARTPDLAARIADHLVDLHLAAARPAADVPSAEGRAALGREIKEHSEALAAIESEIAPLARLSDGTARAQRRDDLAEAQAQAERERAGAEGRSRAVRELLDKGNVEAIGELQTSPTLHQLIAERVRVEVQKSGAERSLAPDHPRIREMQARLSELRWLMFREATAIAETLDAEVQSARAREAEARARVAGAGTGTGTPTASAADVARLAALQQDAAEKRRVLDILKAREAAQAAMTDAPMRTRARLTTPDRVQAAHAIAIPAFPQKGQLSLLTTVSVLMIGFVAVILRALLRSDRRSVAEAGFADMAATARDRADVRLDTPLLAERPADEARPQIAASSTTREPMIEPVEPGQFVILSTTADAARHLAGRAMGGKGHRTLLVSDGIDGACEARDLASSLATAGRRCVLVDWSRDGKGVAVSLGTAPKPGFNDLLDGRASFDDVIVRLPESDAHFIAAGALPADPSRPLDADWVNLVLDALDEAYEHIVVVAQLDQAKVLFETIEGRFDAGIVMSDRRSQGSTINAGPGVFLGFEVTEIYIVQMDLAQRRTAARRFKRARRQAAA